MISKPVIILGLGPSGLFLARQLSSLNSTICSDQYLSILNLNEISHLFIRNRQKCQNIKQIESWDGEGVKHNGH